MEYVQLGDLIAATKTNRCGDNDFPVLSITKNEGIILQSEKFKKRIASKDTADYKVVHRGQLVQGIHIDEANFGIQEVVDIGIVSPAYKIWDIKSNAIVPKYLEIILRSPRSIAYYASRFNGSIKRRERLSDKDFLQMKIPCPPVAEQIYAIEVLDKAAALIEQRKQQLMELDNLIKARFVELIHENTTTSIKLMSVVEDERIITYGIVKPGEHTVGGVPIIKVKDFPKGVILMDDMLLASRDIESKYKRSRVKEGDLLFSIRGSVGRTAFVPKELVDANITQDTARISVSKGYNPHYIRAALEYEPVQQSINEHVRGVAVRGISLAELREIEIPVVEKTLQDSFGQFIEHTDKSKVVVQKALDEAQTLFDSLMQEYFG